MIMKALIFGLLIMLSVNCLASEGDCGMYDLNKDRAECKQLQELKDLNYKYSNLESKLDEILTRLNDMRNECNRN